MEGMENKEEDYTPGLIEDDEVAGTDVEQEEKEGESKADKFVRLGESRVNKILAGYASIDKLHNSGAYEYTDEQIEKMFGVLEQQLAEVKSHFSAEKKKNKFSF